MTVKLFLHRYKYKCAITFRFSLSGAIATEMFDLNQLLNKKQSEVQPESLWFPSKGGLEGQAKVMARHDFTSPRVLSFLNSIKAVETKKIGIQNFDTGEKK